MANALYPEADRDWFERAASDLRSARALIALEPPETGTTAFHCQQAAEKYLKGLLAYHGDDPPRTHDLQVLLDLALRYEPTLDRLREAVRFLNPFAVDVRYPFAGDPPTAADAGTAVERAQEVCDAVRQHVPLA